MSRYFLTGGTGTVGSCVLQHLLEQRDCHIDLLVRADSDSGAELRKLHLLQSVIGDDGAKYASRVTAIRGDTQLPLFGMPRDHYERLVGVCTHLIHSAGLVRMNLPIEKARASAVGSAENIIHFARALKESGQLQKVEFVSTVGVGGYLKEVREDWIENSRIFHNTYEQAKAEAEIRIREAIGEGLPITVHRPSMVVGDSRTGHTLHFQVFYFLLEFLSGARTHGVFPDVGSARLDIVPVDFVAEAIVRSSESAATIGKVLHLCAGPLDAVPIRQLQAMVHDQLTARGERVYKTRYIARPVFRGLVRGLRLFVDAKTRAALGTLPIFLDYLDTEQSFDNVRSMAWLKQEGIAISRTGDYLPRVLQFYFSAKRPSRPRDVADEAGHESA